MEQSDTITQIAPLIELLGVLAILFILIASIASKSWFESLVAAIIMLIMIFYYTETIQLLILTLTSGGETPRAFDEASPNVVNGILRWMEEYKQFVLNLLPNFQGFTIANNRLLYMEVNKDFIPIIWPTVALFVGIIVRLVIYRFIINKQLQRVGREYWLLITAFIIFALIFSSITNWSLLGTILTILIIIFILAAGFIRVIADLVGGLWHSLEILGRLGKVGMMYIALAAARVTRILRRLVRFVKKIYDYIKKPFERLYEAIRGLLERAEKHVRGLLEKEELDEERSDVQQPIAGKKPSATETQLPLQTQSLPTYQEEQPQADTE